jgi:thiamine-phosphate pyrophosphorylase
MLCLVTDRRRMCGPDSAFETGRRRLVDLAREAVDAGVDLIQVRERDLEGGALADLVSAVLGVTHGTATRVVVNERIDVALACGADGVHLRGESLSVAEARRIVPEPFLIGRSVHSACEAAEAGAVDYLIAGTVFSTRSKVRQDMRIGPDGLRAVVSAANGVPVLAIGGITEENAPLVAGTGAAGIAAIGLFAGTVPLRSLVASIAGLFDSARRAS